METSKLPSSFLFFLAYAIVALASIIHAQNTPQDYVNAHNAARSQVNVPPVTWDASVAAYAQTYANQRAASDCKLIHSGGRYGENLSWGGGGMSGTDGVSLWVNEKRCYDHNTNSCINNCECRHYTQVVWRNSVRIGCGRAQCANNPGYYFVICSYDPRGNYIGESPY